MLLVGLTGSIGMGKSTIANRFRANGMPTFDADKVVHDLYNADAVQFIKEAFPETIRNEKVDRNLLSQKLLADPMGFQRLQNFIHPIVEEKQRQFLNYHFLEGAQVAVLEIPLLFEIYGDARCDVTVVASSTYDIQRMRVLQRPGMTELKFKKVLSLQLSNTKKKHRADFIVNTEQSIENSYNQVDEIAEALMIRKGIAFKRYWQVF